MRIFSDYINIVIHSVNTLDKLEIVCLRPPDPIFTFQVARRPSSIERSVVYFKTPSITLIALSAALQGLPRTQLLLNPRPRRYRSIDVNFRTPGRPSRKQPENYRAPFYPPVPRPRNSGGAMTKIKKVSPLPLPGAEPYFDTCAAARALGDSLIKGVGSKFLKLFKYT